MKRLVLLLVASACGRELHQTVDAGPPDAAVDAPESNGEPTSTAVTLTITRLGGPVQGVTVVFQDPSSTVIAQGTTDAMGRAWAEMSTGFVTAIENVGANSAELTTFAAVMAGDSLRLDHTPPPVGTDRSVHITVPTDINGADGYTVHTSCGPGGTDAAGNGQIELTQCGTSADVVVLSTLDGLPTGRGFHVANVPMPEADGTVQLTGDYAAFANVTLAYQDVPAQVQSIVGQQVLSASARAFVATESAVPENGSANIPIAIPGTSGVVLTESTLYPMSGELGQQQLFAWSNSAQTVTTNVGTSMLRAYASAPVYDLAARAITWTERTGGTAPDLVRAGIQVHRDDIPEGRAWKWRIAAARTNTSITFPALPTLAGFDHTPAAGDVIAVDELTTMRLPNGLVRGTMFAPPSSYIGGPNGELVVQTLYSEPL